MKYVRRSILLGGIALLFMGTQAQAQVILDDNLSSASACSGVCVNRTVEGSGVFTAAGWKSVSSTDRVIYDLGQTVACGSLEFKMADFAPFSQYQSTPHFDTQHLNFMGLFANPNGDHWNSINNNEAVLMLKYAPCLVGAHPNTQSCGANMEWIREAIGWVSGLQPMQGCDQGATCDKNPVEDWDEGLMTGFPNTPTTYNYKLEWDSTIVRIFVNGVERTTHFQPEYPNCCHLHHTIPQFRYLYLGKTTFLGMQGWGHFSGPVYSNVKLERCTDACEGQEHCSNQIKDCDEEDVDCGGSCAPCPTPDAGVESGPEPPFDAADDSTTDAAQEDVAQDTFPPPDAKTDAPVSEIPKDSGSTQDAQTPSADTSNDDSGCSCRQRGSRSQGLGTLAWVGLGWLIARRRRPIPPNTTQR